jgi:hypothetical protein
MLSTHEHARCRTCPQEAQKGFNKRTNKQERGYGYMFSMVKLQVMHLTLTLASCMLSA